MGEYLSMKTSQKKKTDKNRNKIICCDFHVTLFFVKYVKENGLLRPLMFSQQSY